MATQQEQQQAQLLEALAMYLNYLGVFEEEGIQSQEQFMEYLQGIGEDGVNQYIQQMSQDKDFLEQYKAYKEQQGVQAAKFGMKINYLRTLRGACPYGEEMVYYKKGGKMCKKCVKKDKGIAKKYQNPIEEFRAQKKK